ncbi:retrovirus-related pol polyprotein from transposon TNT 1-94 [Tanacetum coccineum]
MLSSTGVKLSTSASGSQPSGNTKKDKIQQTPSSTQKNKVKSYPRKVKSSLKNKDCVVAPKGTANVQHSKLNANSKLKCVKCNGCMLFDNHDLCVLDFINYVNARAKSKSVKKRNVCPLTRITTTTEVLLRKPTALENETPKPVVTLAYSRKPRKSKTNVPVSKSKVLKYVSANKKEHSQSWGSIVFDVPSFSLDECRNDHVEKILGYGNYQIGNVIISRVYYIEGLGHNLFSVVQFCDSNHEVAFRQHTCFIHNVEARTYASYNQKLILVFSLAMHPQRKHFDLYKPSTRESLMKSHGDFFDELTAMTSKHSNSGPALHEMTLATISSGLVPNLPPLTPFVPPLRSDWDFLFQPMFDELLTPPPTVDHPAPKVIAPIADVVAPEPAASTGLPSSTTVDQDAPSPSNFKTTPETQSPVIPNDVEEDNHDLHVVHMNNDPFILLHDAFLSSVEPKNYKDALTQVCWIEAMQEELNEFERLEVWELIPRPDKVMVITLNGIYKVKLDELGGILKIKARLVARGYRQEEGIDFEEFFALLDRLDAI